MIGVRESAAMIDAVAARVMSPRHIIGFQLLSVVEAPPEGGIKAGAGDNRVGLGCGTLIAFLASFAPADTCDPGQGFIVVKIRATNPSPTGVAMRGRGAIPREGPAYLRIRADNGVLLQVIAELSPLPTEFPGKAEQDTLYAWRLPLGSKNPKLVILSPDSSEHELELGPLPPP
jgi:hypothetical protein